MQAECGEWFCAVLTGSGDVYAWWIDSGAVEELYWETRKTTAAFAPAHEAVIPCQTLEFKIDPLKLPSLPDLPDLLTTGLSGEELKKETKLIKIAACNDSLIGLTNKGHVLKLDRMEYEDGPRTWRYVSKNVCSDASFLRCGAQLPYYSEINELKKVPGFRPTTGSNGQKRPPQVESTSDTLLITHVSNTAPID